jgi:hypothetical protein
MSVKKPSETCNDAENAKLLARSAGGLAFGELTRELNAKEKEGTAVGRASDGK